MNHGVLQRNKGHRSSVKSTRIPKKFLIQIPEAASRPRKPRDERSTAGSSSKARYKSDGSAARVSAAPLSLSLSLPSLPAVSVVSIFFLEPYLYSGRCSLTRNYEPSASKFLVPVLLLRAWLLGDPWGKERTKWKRYVRLESIASLWPTRTSFRSVKVRYKGDTSAIYDHIGEFQEVAFDVVTLQITFFKQVTGFFNNGVCVIVG